MASTEHGRPLLKQDGNDNIAPGYSHLCDKCARMGSFVKQMCKDRDAEERRDLATLRETALHCAFCELICKVISQCTSENTGVVVLKGGFDLDDELRDLEIYLDDKGVYKKLGKPILSLFTDEGSYFAAAG